MSKHLSLTLPNRAAIECGPSYYGDSPVALRATRTDSYLRSDGPPVEVKAEVRLSLIDARNLAAILVATAANKALPTDAPSIASGWVEVLPEPEGNVLLLIGPEAMVTTVCLDGEKATALGLHMALLVATHGALTDLDKRHAEEKAAAEKEVEEKGKPTVEALVALAAGFKAEAEPVAAPEASEA